MLRLALLLAPALPLAAGPEPPLRASTQDSTPEDEPKDPADIADVPWVERHAEDEEHMLYHLIGYDPEAEAPEDGYRLLVVLPGGDGQADFRNFVRRIQKHVLDERWITVQLVAPVWEDGQKVVWPSDELPHRDMEFTTGEFISAVIDEVEDEIEIDPDFVFSMGWSSSGTEVYRSALEKKTKITGAFVAMSVWHPDQLPKLRSAKGRAFAILHSAEDFIPIEMAKTAREALAAVPGRGVRRSEALLFPVRLVGEGRAAELAAHEAE